MSKQSRAWNEWLNNGPVTVEAFVRSAIPELPLVTTPIRMPDPKVWGDLNEEI